MPVSLDILKQAWYEDHIEHPVRKLCTYPWSACNSFLTHSKDCPSYGMAQALKKLKDKHGTDEKAA
jgi:hypothetical protein